MIIDIDTINERAELILLNDAGKIVGQGSISEKHQVAEKVLPVISDLLAQIQATTGDLKAVIVNLGPGSYTGQRIGVTTANLIAFSLNIPVIGYKDGQSKGALGRAKKENGKFVPAVPLYAQPPKITKKR